MTQQIEIDDEVLQRLVAQIRSFGDTPNSVLRRLLGLPNTQTTPAAADPASEASTRPPQRSTRAQSKTLLPEQAYELPLLQSLIELGGSSAAKTVIDLVGKKLDAKLTPVDRQTLKSGDVRWQNRVQFVRLTLVKRGLMSRDSPWGIWEISEQGRKFVGNKGVDRW